MARNNSMYLIYMRAFIVLQYAFSFTLICLIWPVHANGLGLDQDDLLMNTANIRTTPISDLSNHASRVITSATADNKATIKSAIYNVYVNEPERTASITFEELKILQQLNCYLNAGGADRSSIVSVWLEESGEADNLPIEHQVWLLNQFQHINPVSDNVETLKTRVLLHLSNEADRMTTRQLASHIRALASHLDESEKSLLLPALGEQWSKRIDTKEPFNLTDSREMSAIRLWQDIFIILGDVRDQHSQYITHLPDYLSQMTETELYWRFRYEYVELLAQPIRTDAGQDQLLEMARTDGSLRQDILQVLSSSYRQTDQQDAWNMTLEGKIQDPGLSEDQRAQWMIAKAYSLSLAGGTEDRYMPRHGLDLLHDAIELAQTDQTRQYCLQQIVEIYSDHFWFDKARETIAKYRFYFQTDNANHLSTMEARVDMVEHIARQVIQSVYPSGPSR